MSGLVRAFAITVVALQACPTSAQTRAAPAETPTSEATSADPPDIAAIAARFDHEPTVAEVLREALARQDAGYPDPARAVRRARRSALLPELRLRARRGRERDASETQTGTNLSTDDDALLEGTLVFQLPRTVYSGDEAAWSREARAQTATRLQLVRLVVSLYFERRRLQIEHALGDSSVESLVRIAELEALLDGLTGGRFRELLRDSQDPAAI